MSVLKYEFICHYNNGLNLLQNDGTQDENNFSDIDQDKLEIFELRSKEKSFSVNLKTGEFMFNGLSIYFEELPNQADYRLVYFRRVRQTQMSNGLLKRKIKYCFGLQCVFEGKNYQVLVWIDEETDEISIGTRK